MQQDRRKRDVSTPLSPELKWKMSLFDSREVEFWGWVGCSSLFSCVCFVSIRPFLISTKYPSFHVIPLPHHLTPRDEKAKCASRTWNYENTNDLGYLAPPGSSVLRCFHCFGGLGILLHIVFHVVDLIRTFTVETPVWVARCARRYTCLSSSDRCFA